MRDRAVAEADLMTLLMGLEVGGVVCLLSPLPESRRWRARRAARSLMALGADAGLLSVTVALVAAPLAPAA